MEIWKWNLVKLGILNIPIHLNKRKINIGKILKCSQTGFWFEIDFYFLKFIKNDQKDLLALPVFNK